MRVLIGVELEELPRRLLAHRFPELEFVDALGADALLEAIPDFEVLFGGRLETRHVEAASRLKWVQTYSAGVNHLPFAELAARNIVLTNASGAHAVQIAENILAMILAFAIRIPDLVRAQQERKWKAREIAPLKFEVEGSTLLVIGLGGIGAGLALKAKGLGMRVIGMRNRDLPPPPGVDEVIQRDALIPALGQADHVALCLPLTQETTGFLGEKELRAMRPTAYVYNVGRGKSIDREALLSALQEGWIAGAGLDVTDPEPLPPEDPLWDFPNVILSQHTSGSTPHLDLRVTELFAENLQRFIAGEPLKNRIDLERGY